MRASKERMIPARNMWEMAFILNTGVSSPCMYNVPNGKGTNSHNRLFRRQFIVSVPKLNSCPQASWMSIDFADSLYIIHGHNSHH
jgi:hypothetical protein